MAALLLLASETQQNGLCSVHSFAMNEMENPHVICRWLLSFERYPGRGGRVVIKERRIARHAGQYPG